MAIRTITASTGGNYPSSWNEVTVTKASYGTYDGTKYIDIWFDGVPDNCNLRCYEKISEKSGEEFAIARIFKYANAGIQNVVSQDGKSDIITYDDEPQGLVGKKMWVYFYKGKSGYTTPLDQPAPVAQQGEHISYSEEDVDSLKDHAFRYYSKYKKPKEGNGYDTVAESMDDVKEALGFKSDNSAPPF